MKKKGFTLFELAMVLVIFSLLVIFFEKGKTIINSARLKSAAQKTIGSPIATNSHWDVVLWLEPTLNISLEDSGGATPDDGEDIAVWRNLGTRFRESTSNDAYPSATGMTSPHYKEDGIGNLPTVSFNGSTDGFALENILEILNSPLTVFVVHQPLDNYRSIFVGNYNIANCYPDTNFEMVNNDLRLYWQDWSNFYSESPTSVTHYEPNISSWVVYTEGSYATTNLIKYRNNGEESSDSSTAETTLAEDPDCIHHIGRDGRTDTTSHYGYISEIIIIRDALTDSEIDEVTTYLQSKYKIQF